MKPSKKKPAKRKPKLGNTIQKLVKLVVAIETYKGPSMSIDDVDYRWVDDRIRFMERDDLELTKKDMKQANELWRLYG